jgi:hypothetical protein
MCHQCPLLLDKLKASNITAFHPQPQHHGEQVPPYKHRGLLHTPKVRVPASLNRHKIRHPAKHHRPLIFTKAVHLQVPKVISPAKHSHRQEEGCNLHQEDKQAHHRPQKVRTALLNLLPPSSRRSLAVVAQ